MVVVWYHNHQSAIVHIVILRSPFSVNISPHIDVLPSDGLAWDWINEKLYWTDPEDVEIEVYDPATDHRRSLLSTGTFSVPRGLAVDPTTRYTSRRKHINWVCSCDYLSLRTLSSAFTDGSTGQTGEQWPK